NPVTTAEAPGRYGAIVNIEGENGFKDRRFFTLFRTRETIAWRAKQIPFTVELPAELGISTTVTHAQQTPLSDYLKWQTVDGFSRDPYSAVLLAGLAETEPGSSSARVDSRDGKWWHALRKKTGDQHPLQYLLSLPQGYAADLTKRWPLILFLHGSGERGDDLERVKTHGPPQGCREACPSFHYLIAAVSGGAMVVALGIARSAG
ncbi:MAG TPA: hypothetical protein VHR86_09625, partial [Armatimonadota bacterium]|nr:hypothetical protein [Armatimonadota bacterium]